MNHNIYLDGMMGLICGDALGCPVQFMSRDSLKERGFVTGMEGYGTFNKPEGSWTDDSSTAIATLVSIIHNKGINLCDIMERFSDWNRNGTYTPFGYAYDQGITFTGAIYAFEKDKNPYTCGMTGEHANGNGALMRILPVCLYYVEKVIDQKCTVEQAVQGIHEAAALTHNHLRSNIACGLYFFMVKSILDMADQKMSLLQCLQRGIKEGAEFYGRNPENTEQLNYYARLMDLTAFSRVNEDEIKSSGYVVDSIEAAVWALITTDSMEKGLLKAVNLAHDSDTVAAIAGGLAGLYYGYDAIPAEWLQVIQRRDWIENILGKDHGLSFVEYSSLAEDNMTENSMIQIVQDNILNIRADAIVNAANEQLLQGGGVCGAIFHAAGAYNLTQACNAIGHCDTGKAVITPSFDHHNSKYIIHAVGPIWKDGYHSESIFLYNAYMSSLELAKKNGCTSIAFPLISTGIYGYPIHDAWEQALRACNVFLKTQENKNFQITFAVLQKAVYNEGQQMMKKII